ncbi:nucleolin 1-like [Nicotiana tomentosiformis]|uniref:nucleolin 1-like n=1 Tax=Nicotiana tomentosiformis TaxID=4098 RepID=UPI00388C969D
MAKTSKTVPQQIAFSSFWPATGTEAVSLEVVALETTSPVAATNEQAPEPHLSVFIPGDCSIVDNFKDEKPSRIRRDTRETDPPPTQKADEDPRGESSQDASSAPKEVPITIKISGKPSFTESMLEEAQTRKEKSNKGSAIAERDALGKELEITRSKSEATRDDAEEIVAQYRADVEAAKARLKTTTEYVRRLSRRETLEEIHARDFDLSAEIDVAKRFEVEAKKLAKPEDEEGSEGSNEPEDEEGPNGSGDEVGSGEDQA